MSLTYKNNFLTISPHPFGPFGTSLTVALVQDFFAILFLPLFVFLALQIFNSDIVSNFGLGSRSDDKVNKQIKFYDDSVSLNPPPEDPYLDLLNSSYDY